MIEKVEFERSEVRSLERAEDGDAEMLEVLDEFLEGTKLLVCPF